ncbi:inner centromere protein A-like [Polypterus senegalus]|uniref:inner centromere protein A-like n=1 Tax=Polypterus senegalus TaxID=55291 RepID=UPI001964591F|nr:inner centromere protein A-like [Polypterus senegalus]
MEELSGSNASLKKIFEKKLQGFVDEVENNHMVWLQEILEEAAKMFCRDEPDADVVAECLSVVEEVSVFLYFFDASCKAEDSLIAQRATQGSSKRNAEKCSSPHEVTITNDQNKGNGKAEHSTDLKKRHAYKGTKAELKSQGEDCQADKPVSPVKKSLPVVTVPKGYSAMKPHTKSFLHTAQRNQLLMSTSNSLGQSAIVKSFIKNTTPLKVDTKDKGRERFEILKKNVDQVTERIKKVEEEKKRKLEMERHSKKARVELKIQGEDCQADKPVSPVKKSLPVVTVPKGYSAMKPHTKSFLHTAQRNQLLMSTSNSLGQSAIVKSFIKHTTPLKVDTKEKGRQHLEMLKKKKDQEIKRIKKMEEEKKWKLEEMKREQELLEKEKAIAVQLKAKRAVEEKSALEAAKEKGRLQKETVEKEKLRQKQLHKANLENELKEKQKEEKPAKEEPDTSSSHKTLNITIDLEISPQSYEMTPKGHIKTIEQLDSDDYGMDLKSDDSTDDENAPRKPIPSWAKGRKLIQAIKYHYYNPADHDKLFGEIEPPNLEEIFSKTNMHKAFTVCFPSDEVQFECGLDDPDLFNDLTVEEQEAVEESMVRNSKQKRLQCFAHTLWHCNEIMLFISPNLVDDRHMLLFLVKDLILKDKSENYQPVDTAEEHSQE